jgi:hypothetical protein
VKQTLIFAETHASNADEGFVVALAFVLVEGNGATALVVGWVSTRSCVYHTVTAHIGKVVEGLLPTALVVHLVAVGAGVHSPIAAHLSDVIKANGAAAFVVLAGRAGGVGTRSDVAIAAHLVCAVEILAITLAACELGFRSGFVGYRKYEYRVAQNSIICNNI